MSRPLVVAITGASGAVYAARLLQVLLQRQCELHVTISPSGRAVVKQELDVDLSADRLDVTSLVNSLSQFGMTNNATDITQAQVFTHHYQNFLAPIASGSFLTGGMVVCPCSGGTLSGIVHGASGNLVHRAADVHLKERRRLVLVPRETPLSTIYLDNLRRASEAGAVVLPAMPGWYHGVKSLADLVDFVVARILDQLDIPHHLMRRWGSDEVDQPDV